MQKNFRTGTVAKKADERAKRQLKLLEKFSELEKQKLTEEVLIAREDATRVAS